MHQYQSLHGLEHATSPRPYGGRLAPPRGVSLSLESSSRLLSATRTSVVGTEQLTTMQILPRAKNRTMLRPIPKPSSALIA